MNRRRELVERERVVALCLESSLRALRVGLLGVPLARRDLPEWIARAETSLLFAAAELAYLTSPAPAPISPVGKPWR